jgi:pyruvate dehydrogenase E2 component (dihydrolipoamide acetyltransferase)
MAKILEMPKLSPTMEEGVLATWHKKEGDSVEVDDLLAEVETDKATMEFRAFDKGTLLKLLVQPGAKVLLGQPVAIMGNAGEDVAGLVAKASGGGAAQAPAAAAKDQASGPPTPPSPAAANAQAQASNAASAASTQAEGANEKPGATVSPTMAPPAPAAARGSGRVSEGGLLDRTMRDAAPVERAASGGERGERVLASPYVRKAARERGIDLHGAVGSGPNGRIVAQDLESIGANVKTSVNANGAHGVARGAGDPRDPRDARDARDTGAAIVRANEPPRLAEPEVRPLSMMRKTIARRLTESKQTVPHFYLVVDVDASSLVALREQINRELAPPANGSSAKKEGAEAAPLKVSVNDLLIKSVATALTRVPECNAQFTPDAILVHRRVDISVAVAIPDGLVTPVVRNADQKSVVAIAREVRDLAARARAKKLKPEEMQDGTFSISNLGMFGIDQFAAVINPPEGAILAIGQVRDEPVVRDGALAAGKKLAMTLSCDHRVVDGAVGAAFLAELRALVEHPMRVLTG